MPNFDLDQADVKGKRVLLRVDLNVPTENGPVTDATRDRAHRADHHRDRRQGRQGHPARPFRPAEGAGPEESLKPIAAAVALIVERPVAFADDCIGAEGRGRRRRDEARRLLCLENTRFHKGEEKNDPPFVAELAKLGDLCVNDAFSAAHRAHASTEVSATSCPPLPAALCRPSSKRWTRRWRRRSAGGRHRRRRQGFDQARPPGKPHQQGRRAGDRRRHGQHLPAREGHELGKSLAEKDLADTARRILDKAEKRNCAIILPVDAIVAYDFKANAPCHAYGVDAIPDDGMILDVGPQSIERVKGAIDGAATLVWNGPLGAFELTPFDKATVDIARYAAAGPRTASSSRSPAAATPSPP